MAKGDPMCLGGPRCLGSLALAFELKVISYHSKLIFMVFIMWLTEHFKARQTQWLGPPRVHSRLRPHTPRVGQVVCGLTSCHSRECLSHFMVLRSIKNFFRSEIYEVEPCTAPREHFVVLWSSCWPPGHLDVHGEIYPLIELRSSTQPK